MTFPPAGRPGSLDEDLPALAEYGFRMAEAHCRDCKGYHALWGYERLAGVKKNSFETERDLLEPLLLGHIPRQGRILIAGAADAGLLAFTVRATASRQPRITVADRCATPLAVCRHYAQSHRLDVETAEIELATTSLPPQFDLAFAHNVLMMMPVSKHAAFLADIRRSLASGGVFVLVNRVRGVRPQPVQPAQSNYAAEMLAGLMARGIPLPEARERFKARLSDYAEAQKPWSNAVITQDNVENALVEAGFHIRERIEHDRRRTIPARDGGEAVKMATHIFVAAAQD